jgi:putative nucleotidyltransferase with HDIG domain
MTNKKRIQITTTQDAYKFLRELGASDRLILHSQLVCEVAEKVAEQISRLGIMINRQLVLLGAVLHDVGKICHPEELEGAGNRHEEAGESLLVEYGIAHDIARCCKSHGQWQTMNCSLEEYLVAVSDTVWKGKRDSNLEIRIVDIITERTGRDKWEILIELDALFESIAAEGPERLMRSQ